MMVSFSSILLIPNSNLLKSPIFLHGPVATGYGRGSKTLGFPTANLPYFDSRIQSSGLSNGVYFGWSKLEKLEYMFPVVTNIGYSPTFTGQENKIRIAESHIITKSQSTELLKDFYGDDLRLYLVGYLRSEIKFKSLDTLKTQIQSDIDQTVTIDSSKNQKGSLLEQSYKSAQSCLNLPYNSCSSNLKTLLQNLGFYDIEICETFGSKYTIWARNNL